MWDHESTFYPCFYDSMKLEGEKTSVEEKLTNKED